MSKRDTMYTLGQIARVAWRDREIPQTTLDKLLTMPATGLSLAVKAAKKSDQNYIVELVDRLPANLADPQGGVKIEDQGGFWMGYYQYVSALESAENYSADELAAAGSALYGERWQSDLARDLGVDSRRIRQWMSSDRRIPAGVWSDISGLLRHRQISLQSILSKIS